MNFPQPTTPLQYRGRYTINMYSPKPWIVRILDENEKNIGLTGGVIFVGILSFIIVFMVLVATQKNGITRFVPLEQQEALIQSKMEILASISDGHIGTIPEEEKLVILKSLEEQISGDEQYTEPSQTQKLEVLTLLRTVK